MSASISIYINQKDDNLSLLVVEGLRMCLGDCGGFEVVAELVRVEVIIIYAIYEPAPRQNTAKRAVPLDHKLPKKSVVAPNQIIQGSELEQLRMFNRKMQEDRDSQNPAKNDFNPAK